LRDYFEVEENEYTTAASNYVWSALAGRVLEPGVKADMVLILVGLQGAGKSTAVSSMVPDLQFFTEISFSEKDDNLARMMRGRLIAELGELRGLNTKDLEGIKAFITRQQESWIPKWREFATSYMRRTVFIGTTNADEFLADETGNRRFLPVRTGNVDVAAIARDCLQLWAEARDMYQLLGIQWRGVEELAKPSHAEHAISDLWEQPVRTWLETQNDLTGIAPIEQPYLRGIDILQNALSIDPKNATRREQMRIGKVLSTLGYKSKKIWLSGKVANVFLPTSSNLWIEDGMSEGA
jgi:predicted P-loop ATPase